MPIIPVRVLQIFIGTIFFCFKQYLYLVDILIYLKRFTQFSIVIFSICKKVVEIK